MRPGKIHSLFNKSNLKSFVMQRAMCRGIFALPTNFSTFIFFFSVLFIVSGCKKDTVANATSSTDFAKVNLVASTNQFNGAIVDANLINGVGLALSPTGTAWISAEGSGKSVVYSPDGVEVLPPVSIPTGGHPTGIVYNATTDFIIPGGVSAKYIFVGTTGVISAWSSGTAAVKLVDNSSTSVYTGIAIAADAGANFLYVANWKLAKVDVFDHNFNQVSKPFIDSTIPDSYSPYNIQSIGGQLYVTYARVDITGEEEKGAGLGFVDIFNPNGSLVKKFVSQGELNVPWGVALAPAGYFEGNSNASILVGNFGDGRINAYNTNGDFMGKVKSGGSDVVIDGLWGIVFNADASRLYFTSGPHSETQGLFGYIKK
jgi:uncharacterized protein (TIGR03118 family)